MNDFLLKELKAHELHIPGSDFLSLLAENSEHFIFIKNQNSIYQYANKQFLELMGLSSLKNIYQQTDYDLCRDKQKVKVYLQHDEEVFTTEKMLIINDEVMPKKNELLRKTMVGQLYPIFSEGSKPTAVVGIVRPKYHPFKLNLEYALSLTKEEMEQNFIRRSYPVVVHNKKITLSKREVQCIIELLKGKHAGEISSVFQLKQTTIEFYIDNIKDKLGATSKSSLIMTIFNQKIIQQIVL